MRLLGVARVMSEWVTTTCRLPAASSARGGEPVGAASAASIAAASSPTPATSRGVTTCAEAGTSMESPLRPYAKIDPFLQRPESYHPRLRRTRGVAGEVVGDVSTRPRARAG